jgi:polyhydroxyalkanoate synthesis repressor PhaR
VKIIKRYANRKLYDTESSTYVTLEDIAEMVKAGVEFSILDNRSKRDITSQTLAQILCEEEKRQPQGLSLNALRSLIRTGEDFFQRKVRTPLFEMRDKTQETVERIIGRSPDEGAAGSTEPGTGEQPAPPPEAGNRALSLEEVRAPLRELFEGFQQTMDESLHTIDEQIRRVLDGMIHLPVLQREIDELRLTVERLEARVATLEADRAAPPADQTRP